MTDTKGSLGFRFPISPPFSHQSYHTLQDRNQNPKGRVKDARSQPVLIVFSQSSEAAMSTETNISIADAANRCLEAFDALCTALKDPESPLKDGMDLTKVEDQLTSFCAWCYDHWVHQTRDSSLDHQIESQKKFRVRDAVLVPLNYLDEVLREDMG